MGTYRRSNGNYNHFGVFQTWKLRFEFSVAAAAPFLQTWAFPWEPAPHWIHSYSLRKRGSLLGLLAAAPAMLIHAWPHRLGRDLLLNRDAFCASGTMRFSVGKWRNRESLKTWDAFYGLPRPRQSQNLAKVSVSLWMQSKSWICMQGGERWVTSDSKMMQNPKYERKGMQCRNQYCRSVLKCNAAVLWSNAMRQRIRVLKSIWVRKTSQASHRWQIAESELSWNPTGLAMQCNVM